VIRRFAAAALLASMAAPAAAQQAPCELHVWPSDGMSNLRQRGSQYNMAGGILGDALKRRAEAHADKADARAQEGLAASGTEPMSTATQAELLRTMPLPDMLGLRGYTLIVHDTPLDSHTIRTVKTRYAADSAAPCYADLVVDDVVYARVYAHGSTLKTLFRFRDFASQAAPVRSFGTFVETKLTIFSIDPPNLSAPALDEIGSAYRANATRFSELLGKRP
jgi:hypothetical protein